MTENRMYSQRKQSGNIPVIRICGFGCVYCAFKRFRAMSKCQMCRDNIPHSHLEVLQRKPPRTKDGEFLTVGLGGDISFMNPHDFRMSLEYCRKWNDRTFLIQSKNPEFFVPYNHYYFPVNNPTVKTPVIPDNVILGTTIETTHGTPCTIATGHVYYRDISKAPHNIVRYTAMTKLDCRKAVTIEPILNFDVDMMVAWIRNINPEFVYIGYDNHHHKLPEPSLAKTQELITRLQEAGIEVRCKSIRKAWYE